MLIHSKWNSLHLPAPNFPSIPPSPLPPGTKFGSQNNSIISSQNTPVREVEAYLNPPTSLEASEEADRTKRTHSTGVSILAPGDPSIEGWVLTGSWPAVLESTARLLKSISQGSSPFPQPPDLGYYHPNCITALRCHGPQSDSGSNDPFPLAGP